MLLLLAQLNRDRFQPLLLCPPGGDLQKEARAVAVACADVGLLNARFTWRAGDLFRYLLSFISVIRTIRARVREFAPDLVHANSVRAGLVMSAATIGLRIPVVWHVHDLLPPHPLSSCIRLFVLLRPPQRVVVVAQAAALRFRGKLLAMFPWRVNVAVVYNAVENTRTATNRTASLRRELRLRSTDNLLAIVGNLSPVKGQLELIRAFAMARKTIPDLALLIVGSTLFNRHEGYEQELQREIRALNLAAHVRFLGQRSDVPEIMRELDLLVMNSRSEACPLVALEGMHAGVPILATAVGGVPELLRHEESGWLVPPGGEGKLGEAIVSLLKRPSLRERLAANAQQRVNQAFPMDKFIKEFETIYVEINSTLQRAAAQTLLTAPSPTS